MSKSSNKQRHQQLKEWVKTLDWYKKQQKEKRNNRKNSNKRRR